MNIFHTNNNIHSGESGSALVYILIAVALLALLTVTFMEPSSQQTSSQATLRTVSAIESQINIIRSAIQECVLTYPRGDSTIATGGGGTDPGARKNYPIKPNSTHFNTATIGPTAGRLVKDIRCPGNPGDDNDHTLIFGGSDGKFLSGPPDLFNDWQYYNGSDGVYFWTSTTKTDAFIQTALSKLDDSFAECEADVIDASGATRNLDSAGTPQTTCASGSTCFRVRMTVKSSAVYNGDTDGEETAASCP